MLWSRAAAAVAMVLVTVGATTTTAEDFPDRRVMAWLSVDCFEGNVAVDCKGTTHDNSTDIMRQVAEAEARIRLRQLTDISPAMYAFGTNGTVEYARCGVVCERRQPRFRRAGFRVLPLVSAFGVGSIYETVTHPEVAAAQLVNLTRTFGYDGISLDFEPLDCQNCVSPMNCTVETSAYLHFLNVVAEALHKHGKELQTDYAAWMQTHNFASYTEVAATAVDTIASMDTYGKLGDVFGWITQLNMVASCALGPGQLGKYPCNGRLKLSAGFWPLQPTALYQGGTPNPETVAIVLSDVPPNGIGFAQSRGSDVRQLCIWDAFGETWANATGTVVPRVHQSIPEYWWNGFQGYLANNRAWGLVESRYFKLTHSPYCTGKVVALVTQIQAALM